MALTANDIVSSIKGIAAIDAHWNNPHHDHHGIISHPRNGNYDYLVIGILGSPN